MPERRKNLLRAAAIIGVIGLLASGQGDKRAVVKIIIPDAVETAAALLGATREAAALGLVLGYDDDVPPAGGSTRRTGDFRHYILRRRIEYLLRRVQAQSVEMKFVDPVFGVG